MKERIKDLCSKRGVSMNKLEEELGFGKGYISKLGTTTPNAQKIKLIADFFGVSVDYIITGNEPSEESYYYDEESKAAADFLHKNKEYQVLFDAVRGVKPEDIDFVKQMIDRMTKESK